MFLISSSKTDADRQDGLNDFKKVEYKRDSCINVLAHELIAYCIDNHFHYQYYYGVNAKYIFRLKF
ncbi:hypothetical protein GCM10009110_09520 [Psychrobacter piscatorii]